MDAYVIFVSFAVVNIVNDKGTILFHWRCFLKVCQIIQQILQHHSVNSF